MTNFKLKAALLTTLASTLALGGMAHAQLVTQVATQETQEQVKYLVQFAPNYVVSNTLSAKTHTINIQANKLANNVGVSITKLYSNAGMVSVIATPQQLAQLKKNPNIVNIVRADAKVNITIPEMPVTVKARQSNSASPVMLQSQSVGSWGIDRIDQRDNNYDGQYQPQFDGSGVIVYVMDSGVALDHELLKNRVAYTKNTYNPAEEAFDCQGHGSHVIGTVGVENYGVATGATLVAVRPFNDNCGAGTHESFVGAIEFAVADSQAKGKRAVVNMSLGYTAASADAPLDFFETAIQAGIDAGVVMVTSTGNDSADTCSSAIARMPGVISVAATRVEDLEYMFTNDGPCVDIHAPGVGIMSMDWFSGGVRSMTGTSMAAPHVAGAAALVLQANPDFTPAQVRDYLIEQSTKDVIRSFDSHGAPNRLLYVGDIQSNDGDKSKLSNGVTVTIDGADKAEQIFTIDVPSGQNLMAITTAGQNGDADLYVSFGVEPTTSSYECRSYNSGSNESCNISNPLEGTYHVMVKAYNDFTAVDLTATFSGDVDPVVDCQLEPSHPDCQAGEEINESGLASAGTIVRTINVAAGQKLSVTTTAGEGDADLFVNFNSEASDWWSAECSSRNSGNDESCVIENTQAGTYYIVVKAYQGAPFSGLTLTANAQ
ncbi:MAG: S8 family peptidase [Algicola sp.]|nr:S8 family peptidase [Algicola sp.]